MPVGLSEGPKGSRSHRMVCYVHVVVAKIEDKEPRVVGLAIVRFSQEFTA